MAEEQWPHSIKARDSPSWAVWGRTWSVHPEDEYLICSRLTKLSSHCSGACLLKILSTASPLFQSNSQSSLHCAPPWEHGSNSPDSEFQRSVQGHLENPDVSQSYLPFYLLFYFCILPTGLEESSSEFI